MSLETQIASLVAAANSLTNAVNGKVAEIDAKMDAATRSVPAAIVAEMAKTLFVDANSGLDSAVGSQAAPLRTIEAALAKVPVGAIGIINLRRGQVHNIGGVVNGHKDNCGRKRLNFNAYGAELEKPVIQQVLGLFASSGQYRGAAFEAGTEISIKFSNLKIKTGRLLEGTNLYGGIDIGDYGGFFTRSAGAAGGEGSINLNAVFYNVDIDLEDAPFVTTQSGFINFSFRDTNIVKTGRASLVCQSLAPKVLDMLNVKLTGFGPGATVDTLFKLSAGAYITRQSGATLV